MADWAPEVAVKVRLDTIALDDVEDDVIADHLAPRIWDRMLAAVRGERP